MALNTHQRASTIKEVIVPLHEFKRIRQDVVRRSLKVAEKEQLTPHMLRIVLHSEELVSFVSPSADDHIKIFLPSQSGATSVARDFTPQAWDAQAKTLTIDFALHQQGPAADWARAAKVGDKLEIGGPRGSTVVPNDFDWYLLVGDATALPSMSRRLREIPTAATVQVIALVNSPAEMSYPIEAGDRQLTWLFSTGDLDRDASQLVDTLGRLGTLEGDGLIWIAAEVSVARAAYRYVTDTLGHRKDWIKAAGYWSAGKAEGGERIA